MIWLKPPGWLQRSPPPAFLRLLYIPSADGVRRNDRLEVKSVIFVALRSIDVFSRSLPRVGKRRTTKFVRGHDNCSLPVMPVREKMPISSSTVSLAHLRLRVGLLLTLGCLWLGGICFGTKSFMEEERRPGVESSVPRAWPQGSTLRLSPGLATLVMIAHPKCPCTRASLDQLVEIGSHAPGAIRGYVLFSRPPELPSSWARTSLWEKVAEIPGFTPLEDSGSVEARLFGATTSGHVLLYDAKGALRFSGGITPSRGSTGQSVGRSSIQEYLKTGKNSFLRTPVFGCSVNDSE